ncbi:MAG: hypothetical protein USCAAHI_00526 [Beijerinckiaceae bacterium]|nr:MAG: hypothetical protein USCAAHI_00526 [Beijerinckiaceae bacterium]
MTKKDLANVTADLSALASMLPTQRPAAAAPVTEQPALKVVASPKPEDKEVTQFSLSLRKELAASSRSSNAEQLNAQATAMFTLLASRSLCSKATKSCWVLLRPVSKKLNLVSTSCRSSNLTPSRSARGLAIRRNIGKPPIISGSKWP